MSRGEAKNKLKKEARRLVFSGEKEESQSTPQSRIQPHVTVSFAEKEDPEVIGRVLGMLINAIQSG